MATMFLFQIVCSLIWINLLITVEFVSSNTEVQGPTFVAEPPNDVTFLNTYGTSIPCSATGHPVPSITWRTEDGTVVVNVPGLRHVRWDGSLDFPPFSQEDFRKDVHTAVYRCVAMNNAGILGSRDVRVRAVIREVYEVGVQDSIVPTRNTALIRCHVPSSVSSYVQVSAWLTDDGLTILAHDDPGYSGTKYQAFSTGTLHVASVEQSDGGRRYRCQVTNILTKEKIVSVSWGRLKVVDPVNNQLPRIIQEPTVWEIWEGKTARLPCVAHGYPAPQYYWFRDTGGHLTLMENHRKSNIVDGTLIIHKVTAADSGKYICFANNSVGEDKVDRLLRIRVPLRVEVVTTKRVVRSGEEVSLNCSMTTAPKSVVWVKDQRRIVPDHRIRRMSQTHLKILVFQREDSGIYQCYVYNDWESAQAHVQLDLKEEMPTFIRIFQDQIHMPGQVVSLHCSASGSPLPQIAWTLDGEPLSESRRVKTGDYVHMDGSVLSYVNITDLAVSDGGLYGCEAKNDVGSVSHSARIDVYGPPYIRPMGNLTVVAGTTVTIRCPVSGYPIDRPYVEKSGSKLPFGERQTVDQRGVVRIHNVRKEDEGIYRCVITNGRGEKAERPVVLKVVTAPKINRFAFSEDLEEGMRSSVICSVIAGDPPISLTWYRNGRLLKETSPDIQIVPITDFVSSLIINDVSRHHSGNYTCFASNSAAATNYTTTMIVRAPPVWVIKPSDQSALQGMSVTFDCQAEGQPRPVVRWKFGKDDGSFQSILSSSRIHVLENGSLTITVAEKSDAGYYMCETSNDVGEPLRYSVRLDVHSAPQIQTSTQVVHVRKSEEARFSCSASGDPPLNIVWSREGFPLSLYPENRYITRESESRGVKISEVVIKSAQRKDSDTFTCSASNPFGEDKTTVRLVVQEPPDPPKEVKPLEVTSNSISLSWSPGHPGNSPITSYIISYRQDSEKWPEERAKKVVVSSVDTSATIAGLKPVTTYHIYVIARNAIGQSLPSADLTVTTNAEAPRSPPRHVKAIPLDSSSIRISWQQQPSFMEQVSFVDGYYVGFRELANGGPYVYKTVNIKQGQADANYTLVGLKRGTQYSIVVQAFNSQGAGPPSDEIIVQTSTIDPPAAPVVKVIDTTATSISISWDAKSTAERPITGYILTYKGTAGQWHETRLPASRQNFVLENLQCGTSYQIVLTAVNSVGHGEPSEMIQVTTNGRAPVAPEKSEFLRSNTTSVQLNLRNWLDDGCPISHLVIQYKPQGQKEWILVSNHILTDQEVLLIADLSPGTWHDLLVTAHSDAGTTDAEYRFATLTLTGGTVPPLSVVRPPPFFEDPTILVPIICAVVVLIVIISVTAFVVVWKRREPTGEAPSDIYSRGSGGRADDISMSSYGKAKGNSVYDSQREPLYYPLPYATTHIPNSGHHLPDTAESPDRSLQRGRVSEHAYDVPQRVQHLHNVPVQQYSRLWANSRGFTEKELLSSVGSRRDIEDFDVAIAMAEKYAAFRVSQTRAHEAVLMESSGWSFVVTQLAPKQVIPGWVHVNDPEDLPMFSEEMCPSIEEYDDRSLDQEEMSETECDRDCIGITRQRKSPRSPPRHVKAIPLDSSSIRISWQQQPSFMEQVSFVDGYYVGFRELANGGPYVYKTVNIKQGQADANYTLVGLKRGTQYSIVVQAFNSQGAGPPSNEIIVQTSTIDPPAAPVVKVIDTTATSISISWDAKSTAERPITGYILTYKGTAGQWHETRLPASRQNFVLENLQCGTSYQIVLTAVNSVGHGEPSEMIQVTTNGRAPVAPEKSEFLRSNTTSVQLNLRNWLDDGCPISHLVIQYKPQGQKEWILVSNHILTDQEVLLIADLSPGTWHDLLVTAHSDAGTTDAEYRFATLTLTGGTVPPLSVVRPPPFFEDPTILVPIICAVVVLIVIISVTAFVVVWKRREPTGEAPSDIYSRGSGGRADDISMSSYGKAKGNSVYDSQREPLYYPLPYATTHIPNSGHHLPDTAESPDRSLQRGRVSEHAYDVPQRVQHLHNVPVQQYSRLWANSRGFTEKELLSSVGSRRDIEDFDVAIAMAEKYAAFRVSQTRAHEAVLMESSGWSFVVTQLAPKQVIPGWVHVNDPEDLPMFSEEMCPSIEKYDDRSLDQEEMSETECDRDCIGITRQRKYLTGSYSRVGAVIVC